MTPSMLTVQDDNNKTIHSLYVMMAWIDDSKRLSNRLVKGESKRIKALGSLIHVHNMEFLISSLSYPRAYKTTTKSLVEEVWLTCSELPHDLEKRQAALDLLCQLFRQHEASIHTILFSRSEFGNEQIGRLLPVFYQNQALLELNLSTNQIHGAAGGDAIRTLLEQNDHLKKLILWNNPLGAEGADALASGLGQQFTRTS